MDKNNCNSITRRKFFGVSAAVGVAAANENLLAEQNNSEALVPMRAITRGSKFHWFGYYDKLEFDPTNRYILSNEVDFEHRTPPT